MNTVAVVGAGITGLTAAWRLQQAGVPVTIYEAAPRPGGMVHSRREDGFLAETGPHSILETAPEIAALVSDLDLAARRCYPGAAAKKRFIVRGSRPVPLPGSLGGMVRTPLFSPGGKLRVLAEPFIPPAPAEREESLAEFVRRRLGSEMLDYAIDPFVAGVYAGSPTTLSVKHGFRKLYDLEQKYGSLIRGTILGARERKRRGTVSKASAPMFSFDDGLQVLIAALAGRLEPALRLASPVQSIDRTEEGLFRIQSVGARPETFGAVLATLPAHRLAEMRLPAPLPVLSQVDYPPVLRLALGYRRDQVGHPLDGFGVLVPSKEPFRILGVLFPSSLFPRRAPDGHVNLTVYLGGSREPEIATLGDDQIQEVVEENLSRLLGVAGRPVYRDLLRVNRAIPQYKVGYGAVLDALDRAEASAPGLFFGGNYRGGISVSDCIQNGHQLAGRIREYFHAQTRSSSSQSRVA